LGCLVTSFHTFLSRPYLCVRYSLYPFLFSHPFEIWAVALLLHNNIMNMNMNMNMNTKSRLITLWVVLYFCSITNSLAASKQCHFPAIFNFGDSNSDTGGLSAAFGQAGPPHGESYFHHPAGRYCDGRLIVDFLGTFILFIFLSTLFFSLCFTSLSASISSIVHFLFAFCYLYLHYYSHNHNSKSVYFEWVYVVCRTGMALRNVFHGFESDWFF